MAYIIIGIFIVLFIINWARLRKGESVNKLYDQLTIEPVFVQKYTDAYSAVSDNISKTDYIKRAQGLHAEFQYDVVKYMNRELYGYKLKEIFKEVKAKKSLSFDELPKEVQSNIKKIADEFVATLHKVTVPTASESHKSRRRRR